MIIGIDNNIIACLEERNLLDDILIRLIESQYLILACDWLIHESFIDRLGDEESKYKSEESRKKRFDFLSQLSSNNLLKMPYLYRKDNFIDFVYYKKTNDIESILYDSDYNYKFYNDRKKYMYNTLKRYKAFVKNIDSVVHKDSSLIFLADLVNITAPPTEYGNGLKIALDAMSKVEEACVENDRRKKRGVKINDGPDYEYLVFSCNCDRFVTEDANLKDVWKLMKSPKVHLISLEEFLKFLNLG